MTGGTVAEVLDAAADLLTPEGAWMQEDYCDEMFGSAADIKEASCWCAEGAVACVLGVDGDVAERWCDERVDLFGDLGECLNLADWNDRPLRTQAEVIAKLREAANAARATGEASHG
jgi:hypothetical protein